jgi:hypothetical protein
MGERLRGAGRRWCSTMDSQQSACFCHRVCAVRTATATARCSSSVIPRCCARPETATFCSLSTLQWVTVSGVRIWVPRAIAPWRGEIEETYRFSSSPHPHIEHGYVWANLSLVLAAAGDAAVKPIPPSTMSLHPATYKPLRDAAVLDRIEKYLLAHGLPPLPSGLVAGGASGGGGGGASGGGAASPIDLHLT